MERETLQSKPTFCSIDNKSPLEFRNNRYNPKFRNYLLLALYVTALTTNKTSFYSNSPNPIQKLAFSVTALIPEKNFLFQ